MPNKKKILVVEDNDFVRMQIVRYLAETGADIIEATQGGEALDHIKKQYVDKDPVALAIVDVRMQPVDGFEFIRSVRGLDMDTPVILVTGDNNPDLLEKAGQWGVSAVMMKPVQKDRLVKTVHRTLEASKRKG
ncbi:MAG: response regulator [Micavibrio sp.]